MLSLIMAIHHQFSGKDQHLGKSWLPPIRGYTTWRHLLRSRSNASGFHGFQVLIPSCGVCSQLLSEMERHLSSLHLSTLSSTLTTWGCSNVAPTIAHLFIVHGCNIHVFRMVLFSSPAKFVVASTTTALTRRRVTMVINCWLQLVYNCLMAG